jgi:N-carbamoyl-L-amino-acid hydrolase
MAASATPRIDGGRLWRALTALAEVGAIAGGGVRRVALTDDDRRGRDLFVRWCEAAGLAVRVDAIGNLFARRRGRDDGRPPVLAGSHLDTQPNGGRFDGAYGVMAGLEIVRALDDAGVVTDAPLEIVVWTHEEGTRFAPSMMGSMAFAGLLPLQVALDSRDADGIRFASELERIGYRGDGLGDRAVGAYFEAHIEQGPVLEERGCTIGVVTGGQGQRWYDASLRGQAAHAGTTPMSRRRDALVGAAEMVLAVQRIGIEHGGCATVGQVDVRPNSRNVIPGEVAFSVELRHPLDAARLAMDRALRTAIDDVAQRLALDARLVQVLDQPAVSFDAQCVALVRDGAEREGLRCMDITSGAAHDAIALARVAPTAMVFVPCAGGISHNEAESASPEDLAAGCQVLMNAMWARAMA